MLEGCKVNQKSKFDVLSWLFPIIMLIVIAYAGYVFSDAREAYHSVFGSNLPEAKAPDARAHWGTYGDYIGGTVNPILSFLSLIALFVTILLQSRELKLSRMELEETRQIATEQVRHLKDDASKTELLKVLGLVDEELHKILSNKIKDPDSFDNTMIEFRFFLPRICRGVIERAPFDRFIDEKLEGALKIREVGDIIIRMDHYLISYSKFDCKSPVIKYYREKYGSIARQCRSSGINFDFKIIHMPL
jgi:hypothetical protein